MNEDEATARYKTLEEEIQRLEISQRKREQMRGPRKLKKPDFIVSQKTLPAISRPSTVPGRPSSEAGSGNNSGGGGGSNSSGNNSGGEHISTVEVNQRRDVEDKIDARLEELLADKMVLNKQFSAATSKEYRLQKQIRDKKNALAVLVDQDNINQRRSEVIHHCSREQQQLADKTMSIAVLSNYTRTLNLMKDRLWIKQTTYQKTLDAYYVTLRAAKAEVADVTKMRENASLRLSKAHERNKKFKEKATKVLELAQKQLDGMRDVVAQQEEAANKAKQKEAARLQDLQRRNLAARSKKLNAQMRAADDRKQQSELLDKLDDHEEAFRKIQMASGLETDAEIVDAFNNREAYLSDVVRKVEMLRRQLNEAQKAHNQLKADLVNELVENDGGGGLDSLGGAAGGSGGNGGASGSTWVVMNLWGGKADSYGSMDLSTEMQQQHHLELQRATHEKTKTQELMIKLAQSIEGVFASIAAMQNATLSVEALLAEKDDGGQRVVVGGSSSSVGGGRARAQSGRASTPSGRRERERERERERLALVSPPTKGSILTASHLSQRVSAIDKTAAELVEQILKLPRAAPGSGKPQQKQKQEQPKAKAAAKPITTTPTAADQQGAETAGESSASADAPTEDSEAAEAAHKAAAEERDEAAEAPAADAREPAAYEEKMTEFMWAQKFAVHNNVRVKSVAVPAHTPDDRQSFFLQESKAQLDRAQMQDMLDDDDDDDDGPGEEALLDLDQENEKLFDRNSMKKSSLAVISKNTRRSKKRGGGAGKAAGGGGGGSSSGAAGDGGGGGGGSSGGGGGDGAASPMRVKSPSPRRGGKSIRSSAPGEN
jgi:uncharacterized membrane protein YgcG